MTAAAETPPEKNFSRWRDEIPKGTHRETPLIAGREGCGGLTEAASRVPVPLYYYCTVVGTYNNNPRADGLCCRIRQQRYSWRWA
jgi:hypothetical protein